MSGTPAKKTTPTLADRLGTKKPDPGVEENEGHDNPETIEVDNTHGNDSNQVNNDTVVAPDGEAVFGERPRSSGVDGSDSTEYVTTESGVLVDRTKFDTRGNGVTDNYPLGYLEELPANASPYVHSSENATTRHHVAETVYATPAAIDDKGLGINVDGVTSVNPKTGEVLKDDSNN